MKKLTPGDKAPFQGTLIEDEGLRQIDTELLEKDVCERHLHEGIGSVQTFGWEELIIGVAIGVTATCFVTGCTDLTDLFRSHRTVITPNIRLSL